MFALGRIILGFIRADRCAVRFNHGGHFSVSRHIHHRAGCDIAGGGDRSVIVTDINANGNRAGVLGGGCLRFTWLWCRCIASFGEGRTKHNSVSSYAVGNSIDISPGIIGDDTVGNGSLFTRRYNIIGRASRDICSGGNTLFLILSVHQQVILCGRLKLGIECWNIIGLIGGGNTGRSLTCSRVYRYRNTAQRIRLCDRNQNSTTANIVLVCLYGITDRDTGRLVAAIRIAGVIGHAFAEACVAGKCKRTVAHIISYAIHRLTRHPGITAIRVLRIELAGWLAADGGIAVGISHMERNCIRCCRLYSFWCILAGSRGRIVKHIQNAALRSCGFGTIGIFTFLEGGCDRNIRIRHAETERAVCIFNQ